MATKKAASTKKKATATKNTSSVTKTTVKSAPATAKRQKLGQYIETSLQSPRLWRALAAEFIGTFLLASAVIAGQGQPIFVLFALVGIVLIVGGLSGAHVNPAVTIGAWVTRRIGSLRAIGYILVQFLGAAVAFFTLTTLIGGAPQPTEEQILYGQAAPELFRAADIVLLESKQWYIFVSELIGTAILAFAVAHALRSKTSLTAASSAGFGIFIALMISITVSGWVSASAIINPALAVSLQAFTTSTQSIWPYAVYVLGPVIGGVIGFALYDLLYGKKAKEIAE